MSHSWIFHSYGMSPLPRWRASAALIAINQWGPFSVPHPLCHGASFYNVISEDPCLLHLLPGVWQWICHHHIYGWDWNTQTSACKVAVLANWASAAVNLWCSGEVYKNDNYWTFKTFCNWYRKSFMQSFLANVGILISKMSSVINEWKVLTILNQSSYLFNNGKICFFSYQNKFSGDDVFT